VRESPITRARTLALSGLVLLLAHAALAQVTSLLVRPSADTAPADGATRITITVEVRDALGAPAPDGTRVALLASHGTITPYATTQGGVARAELTAPTYPATAVITAAVEGIIGEATVEFIAGEAAPPPAARLVARITGDRVAFSEQSTVVIAGPHARLDWEGFIVEADEIECHALLGVVRASGPVTVQWKDRVRQGQGLIFSLAQGYGTLLVPDTENPHWVFDRELNERTDRPADPVEEIGGFDTTGTVVWIEAAEAIVFVGDRVHFRRPTFIIQGRRVWSLLYHVAFLQRLEPGYINQILSYDSARGLSLDLPFYLFAGTDAITALHVHRAALFGFSPDFTTPGWSAAFEHQYRLSNGGQGGIWIDDLGGRRAIVWSHAQRFEHQTDGNFSISYDRGIETLPDQGTLSASLTRRIGRTTFSYVGSAVKSGDLAAWASELSADSYGSLLGGWLQTRWRLGAGIGPLIVAPGFFENPDETPESPHREVLHETGALTLSPPNVDLTPTLRLTTALTGRLTDFDRLGLRQSYSGRVGLTLRSSNADKQRTAYGNFSFRTAITQGRDGEFATRQSLDLSFGMQRSRRWEGQVYASYDITRADLFTTGWAGYRFPTGDGTPPRWRVFAQVSHSDLALGTFTDSRVALAYRLGLYELVANYSPNGGTGIGQGFSFGAGSHFWVEVIATRL